MAAINLRTLFTKKRKPCKGRKNRNCKTAKKSVNKSIRF